MTRVNIMDTSTGNTTKRKTANHSDIGGGLSRELMPNPDEIRRIEKSLELMRGVARLQIVPGSPQSEEIRRAFSEAEE